MPCTVQAPREDVYDMRLMLCSVVVHAVLNHVVLITNYIRPIYVHLMSFAELSMGVGSCTQRALCSRGR